MMGYAALHHPACICVLDTQTFPLNQKRGNNRPRRTLRSQLEVWTSLMFPNNGVTLCSTDPTRAKTVVFVLLPIQGDPLPNIQYLRW